MSATARRAEEIFQRQIGEARRRTDVLFGVLLVIQFFAAVLAAVLITPRTWAGATGSIHLHVWIAILLGGCLTALPLTLIIFRRGEARTRYTVAAAQMLYSALLIHLTGGRIETHFHVFGSLAFIAFYRDWKTLIPATVVVAADHILRGVFWPQSVFGVLVAAPWRAFEHAGWVLFENVFLTYSCVQGVRELHTIATTRAHLEETNANIEEEVRQRTREVEERTAELERSEQRYELAVLGSQDGLWDWDLVENTVYYAPRWKELLGAESEDVSDSPDEWFRRITSGNLSQFHADLMRHIEGRSDRFDMEVEMLHADGDARWMRCRAAAIRDSEGKAIRLAGSLADITELKKSHERLRHLAQHDRLTGLPNRERFTERLRQAHARFERGESHGFAVLFFDFDRFKMVNDSLGHSAGDALLRSIAERFLSELRERDIAARFGGDEFIVLLDDINGMKEATDVCDRLLARFAEPHKIDGNSVVSTASIGLVSSDLEYEGVEDLIRDADAAMYQAKMSGKARYRIFDAEMHAKALEQLSLEQHLLHALDKEQFRVVYQPIISLQTRSIVGFEALLRWEHPQYGLVSPDRFISIAEETGEIITIGEWVLNEAIAQLRDWRSESPEHTDLFVNVNLSRRQLVHPALLDSLKAATESHGVEPRHVHLEITESSVMDDRLNVEEVMQGIRDLGFLLAMDDFGTGHSSLSCLHQFPIDALKIDRSFVRNLTERREFTAVMQAIITLAHNLELTVIAEGIEDNGQLAQLQGMDCEFGQGYLFASPATPEEAIRILRCGLRPAKAA